MGEIDGEYFSTDILQNHCNFYVQSQQASKVERRPAKGELYISAKDNLCINNQVKLQVKISFDSTSIRLQQYLNLIFSWSGSEYEIHHADLQQSTLLNTFYI